MTEQPLPAHFSPLLGQVDHVFIPGALLFAPTFRHVHSTLQSALQLLKPGGHLTAGTIPESEAGRGSGKIVIPRNFFLAEATLSVAAHPHLPATGPRSGCGCFDIHKMTSGGE